MKPKSDWIFLKKYIYISKAGNLELDNIKVFRGHSLANYYPNYLELDPINGKNNLTNDWNIFNIPYCTYFC